MSSAYPQELAGEQIAPEARVVAIADVFDALTSRRPYKVPYSEREALQIIHDTAGSHFDPQVHAAFRESLSANRSMREQLSDGVNPSPALEEVRDEADLVCR
jgi:putative two-component system response regulator